MGEHRTLPRWSLVLLVGLFLVPVQPGRADTETIRLRMLRSTGWINCPQPDGTNSWGTCWVYDRAQRLVVTNMHVIDKARWVMVDFPVFRDGQLVLLVQEYLKMAPINGKVLAFDDKRDLALCQLDRIPDGVEAVPLAEGKAQRRNRVFSLGNSSANTPSKDDAKLWRFVTGSVELRYFDVISFSKPPLQKVEATTVRSSIKTARGDSGGAVVNTSGRLVGVHSNGDNMSSFAIDVGEVRVFLERALAPRRAPPGRDLTGTWTVATTDELGRCYWSLTVESDGTCQFERDDCFEGTFHALRDGKLRISIRGAQMRGEVALTWVNDDQFSFRLHGVDYTATRR
jgi:S1-C subfamily serine protease